MRDGGEGRGKVVFEGIVEGGKGDERVLEMKKSWLKGCGKKVEGGGKKLEIVGV